MKIKHIISYLEQEIENQEKYDSTSAKIDELYKMIDYLKNL